MKDRWKIFWITVFFCIILAALFLFMGFSFRKIDLRNYGILRYSYYDTVDATQSPRTNGNYLVGLDHSFIQFPKGLIVHDFKFKTLTKDKSMIQIQGMYAGKLVYTELVGLYFDYGEDYTKYLFASVEELFHEAIEQFSLSQIVADRASVDLYVKNYIRSNIQSSYKWISTKFVSLGSLRTDLMTPILPFDISVQQQYLNKISTTLINQKKWNVYSSGGIELLQSLQKSNSDLFYNITQRLKIIGDKLNLINNTQELLPSIEYVVNNGMIPLVDNTIQVKIGRN